MTYGYLLRDLFFVLCITVVHAGRWECDPDTESCPEWNEFGGEYLVKLFSSSGTCTGDSTNYIHVSPALGCVPIDNGAGDSTTSARGSCDAANRYVVLYLYQSSDCTGDIKKIQYRNQSNFNPLPCTGTPPHQVCGVGLPTTLSIKNPPVCQCIEEPCAAQQMSFFNECTNPTTSAPSPVPASAPAPAPATASAPAPAPATATTPATAKITSTSTTASLSFFGVTIAMIAMMVSSFAIFA